METEEHNKLLQFVTGSAYVPAGGFAKLAGRDGKALPFTIALKIGKVCYLHFSNVCCERSSQLTLCWCCCRYIYEQVPQAHTCFNTLDLPLYGGTAEGKAKMKEVFSLILMFDAGEGIGFSRA